MKCLLDDFAANPTTNDRYGLSPMQHLERARESIPNLGTITQINKAEIDKAKIDVVKVKINAVLFEMGKELGKSIQQSLTGAFKPNDEMRRSQELYDVINKGELKALRNILEFHKRNNNLGKIWGLNLIHAAISSGQECDIIQKMIRIMLSYGANINETSIGVPFTPLDEFIETSYVYPPGDSRIGVMVSFLESKGAKSFKKINEALKVNDLKTVADNLNSLNKTEIESVLNSWNRPEETIVENRDLLSKVCNLYPILQPDKKDSFRQLLLKKAIEYRDIQKLPQEFFNLFGLDKSNTSVDTLKQKLLPDNSQDFDIFGTSNT